MKHSLGTAAIATGRSKTTIHRAIKSGRLSAIKNIDGVFEIDPSELHRVFSPVTGNISMEQTVTHDETALLEQENTFLRLQLEREREFTRDLQLMLKTESEERRKLTALLTFQQEQPPKVLQERSVKKENKLWKKLFR